MNFTPITFYAEIPFDAWLYCEIFGWACQNKSLTLSAEIRLRQGFTHYCVSDQKPTEPLNPPNFMPPQNTAPSAHTPGPWIVSKSASPEYAPQFAIYPEHGDEPRLAIVTSHAANARLIASAPCLLAISREAFEMLAGNPSPEAIETVRAMIATAISKAEGRA